tara:strand:- start:7701 stop:8675 length:975 start_codon:yes stop_codon:yes gene_type:complete
MIIKSYEINKIELNKFNFFLFYGKNEGAQNEIINQYFMNNFKGKVSKYDENEFINNYEIIASEILTKSLFEDEKIIIISRTTDKSLKFIQEIINKDPRDINFLLKSGPLEKKSKIRSFFESNKKSIVIPFYEESSKSLNFIIEQFIRKNQIKLSRESINLLIERSSGDRANLKTELEKIYNYSISNKNIDYNTVRKLSNLSENYAVSEIAESFLSKNKKKISKILNENIYSNDDCILILRTIANKSKRLLNIIEENNNSNNIDRVISSFKPPIFWKEKEIVKNQAKTWKIKDLRSKIYEINNLELILKSNSKNSLNILSDFIIN